MAKTLSSCRRLVAAVERREARSDRRSRAAPSRSCAACSASCSDFSIDVVPTSTGWPRALQSSISAMMARYFSVRGAIDLVVVVDARHRHVGRDLEDLEVVDVHELVGLGQRRAGHAGELLVHAEVVLEGDRGERLVLGLDRLVLLGLERLVQPFRVAPARHHAAGELVDDDDLAVAHDVVLVALEQLVGAQRLVDVVDGRDVLDVVERIALEQARPRAGAAPASPCRLRSASRCAASRRRRSRSCRAWGCKRRWCCRSRSGRRAGRR